MARDGNGAGDGSGAPAVAEGAGGAHLGEKEAQGGIFSPPKTGRRL